jgi:hypothetical protein
MKDSKNTIDRAFYEFAIEQAGGIGAVKAHYLKFIVRESSAKNLPMTVQDLLGILDEKGWREWFGLLPLSEVFSIISASVPATAPTPSRRTRTSSKAQTDKIMSEFKTTPWLTKNDLKRITGIKSFPTIDKLTDNMCQCGLIKQCRGRRVVFAHIDETTLPPLSL